MFVMILADEVITAVIAVMFRLEILPKSRTVGGRLIVKLGGCMWNSRMPKTASAT